MTRDRYHKTPTRYRYWTPAPKTPSLTSLATETSSAWARTAGYTLAELLVALTLLAVLATVLFGALLAHVRLARQLAHRVVEADAVRTASTVIGGELRRAS